MTKHQLSHIINGTAVTRDVDVRLLLSDYLRHELGLVGTRVGCEQGVCGACTVLLDGDAVRSCLVLAAQTDGHVIETVESLTEDPQRLHPIQQAFHEHHALQCGFCTSGFLMTLLSHWQDLPAMDDGEIRQVLSGNICRCTGYQTIVEAVNALQGREEGTP